MDYQMFKTWLDTYGGAWKSGEAKGAEELFTRLFTEDATYQETPFDEPMRGRKAIIEYGRASIQSQRDIEFGYEILAVTPTLGIAQWWTSFTQIPSGDAVRLDGIFVISLNEDGRCTELREWWHSQHN